MSGDYLTLAKQALEECRRKQATRTLRTPHYNVLVVQPGESVPNGSLAVTQAELDRLRSVAQEFHLRVAVTPDLLGLEMWRGDGRVGVLRDCFLLEYPEDKVDRLGEGQE